MRPVVAALLMMMMMMWDSADGIQKMCEKDYPVVPCRHSIKDGPWYQLGDNRCMKAFFHTAHLKFHDAEKACNSYTVGGFKGHLVSIHSMVDLNRVVCAMYKVHTGKPHYWIGLEFLGDLGGFLFYKWTDGTDHVFSRWARGQPDNFLFREGCVEMNYWSWTLWNDEQCGAHRPYMCAVRLY